MKTYIVGGAIRDELLGLPVQDRDHVVVGATPEQMLAAGFRPVGKDFPVFLHPRTHEEYALARTERKTAPGYAGFHFHAAPDVTLEQDLRRRDLTINAMARGDDGRLIDPHGGERDLRERRFRHVSEAFAEDPVRILRLARFAARFTDFTVAPETTALMRAMVEAGEVDALVAERVWQELARGLMEARPSRMFEVLRSCGALARLMPAIDARQDAAPEDGAALDRAAAQRLSLAVRFAVLTHGLGDRIEALCARWRVPIAVRDLAMLTAREYATIADDSRADAAAQVALFERCDAIRKPDRFDELLRAAAVIAGVDGSAAVWPAAERLRRARRAAAGIDAARIAAEGPKATIRERIRDARIAAVRELDAG
ncbi:MAG: multifunctional CCA tRNA nucleotidyl transferase/2'3'-cyclic phosphodiesterase/2'nucleotidase/phosphatase [Burkholderiaceae bacterium]